MAGKGHKNNLQVLSGLLRLQSEELEGTTAQSIAKEGENRVRAMMIEAR